MNYISFPNVGGFSRSFNAFEPKASTFSDGEIAIDVKGFDFSSQKIAIVQSLFSSEASLLQMLLVIDAINRNTHVLPHVLLTYMSYARQDREIIKTAPISAKTIAGIISSQKISTVSIVELHSQQVQGFFEKPCFNISLEDFFIKHIQKNFNSNEIVICAADIGGAKSARKVSEKIGCTSAIVEKVRPEAGVSHAMSLIGNVSGKDCIIVDDIIDTAGTLCNAADLLMQNGARSVVAYATHGIFSGIALERIATSTIQNVFVANTICHKGVGKIQTLDVSLFVKERFENLVANF